MATGIETQHQQHLNGSRSSPITHRPRLDSGFDPKSSPHPSSPAASKAGRSPRLLHPAISSRSQHGSVPWSGVFLSIHRTDPSRAAMAVHPPGDSNDQDPRAICAVHSKDPPSDTSNNRA
ncbi:hypothetical protein ACLOJK_022908 [Asimina triloba]